MNNIQTDGETNDIEITLILMIFMKKKKYMKQSWKFKMVKVLNSFY